MVHDKFKRQLEAQEQELKDGVISKDFLKETRRTEENGFIKADVGKLDFSLVCPYAMEDLVAQLTIGAKKYDKDNWKKGDIFTYISALERHINTIKKSLDSGDYSMLTDDTGVNQCGALMFNSMAIGWFIRTGKIPKSKAYCGANDE